MKQISLHTLDPVRTHAEKDSKRKVNDINVLPIWFIKILNLQFLKSGMAREKRNLASFRIIISLRTKVNSCKNKLLLSLIALYWCRWLWCLIGSTPGKLSQVQANKICESFSFLIRHYLILRGLRFCKANDILCYPEGKL